MRRKSLSEGWRIRYPFAKEAAMPVLPSAEFAMAAKGERDAKRCAQGPSMFLNCLFASYTDIHSGITTRLHVKLGVWNTVVLSDLPRLTDSDSGICDTPQASAPRTSVASVTMILASPCLVASIWHANARITRQPHVARPNAVKIKMKDNFDPQLTYRLHRRSNISRFLNASLSNSDGKIASV